MKETTYNEDAWMDEARLQTGLIGNKGKIVSFGQPVIRQTKFGARKFSSVIVQGSDGAQLVISMPLPPQYPMVHPKSNLAKLMNACKVTSFKALIGKEVDLEQVGDTLWKIKV